MKNIDKNIEKLKAKIAADAEHDYLDIYSEGPNIIVMLNWEKMTLKRSEISGIKFRYSEKGTATSLSLIFKGNPLEVPIYITASEANEFEKKYKKIT